MSSQRPSALRSRGAPAHRERRRHRGRRPGPTCCRSGPSMTRCEEALASAFPRGRQLWVRGEIHSLLGPDGPIGPLLPRPGRPRRRGPDPRPRGPVGARPEGQVLEGHLGPPEGAALAKEGIALAEGMVVVAPRHLDVYRPKGEIGFVLSELDVTALLGRLAAQRAALLAQTRGRGAAAAQRRAGCARGTAAGWAGGQPGTEGYRDFLGQLTASDFGFQVRWSRSRCRAAPPRCRGRAPSRLCAAPTATSSSWCAAADPRPTWPPSKPRSWPAPLPLPPNRSGPASGTRGTSPWPTLWPIGPASLPPSVVSTWSSGSRVVEARVGEPAATSQSTGPHAAGRGAAEGQPGPWPAHPSSPEPVAGPPRAAGSARTVSGTIGARALDGTPGGVAGAGSPTGARSRRAIWRGRPNGSGRGVA